MSKKNSGFIVCYRSLLDWEWYSDPNTKVVFLHCLLSAEWQDRKYKGKIIKRGQLVQSHAEMAKKLGLTVQQVRTACEHLELTGEITTERTSNSRVITVNNYDLYQDNNKQANRQVTSEQQVTQQASNKPTLFNNNKTSLTRENNARARASAPSEKEVSDFIRDRKLSVNPKAFYTYYSARNWEMPDNISWQQQCEIWSARDQEKTGTDSKDAHPKAGHTAEEMNANIEKLLRHVREKKQ